MFAATSLGDAAVHSLIERDKRSPSVFRPPKFVRSSLPSRRRLTATAEPWYPTPDLAADVAAASMPAKPASAPPMPPMALGGVSPLKARPRSSRPPALNDVELGSPSSTSSIPFSPLSTTVSTVFHKFSDDATRERRYPVEMFLSVRKDASHTPHGILQWCVRQYVEVPALKVPPHLQLSMNEVVRAEDGITRGALGCDLRIKSRSKPVRQTHHKVMSVLSRITPQKYKELLEELLQLPLRQADDAELKEIVRVFFDKAVEEHNFSELYSQLVKELCTMTAGEQELDVELQDRLFCNRMKRQLLATCEDQFGIPVELTEDQKVDRTTGIPLDEEEVSHKRQRIKNRLVGNVKFVGELYKKNLVTDQIIETVVQRLVGNFDPQRPQAREEYVFEVFAMLIKTVAEKFKTVKPGLLARFITIAKMVETSHPKKRVQFLMMDLADLNRKHRWVPESRVAKQLDDTPTSTKTSCLSQVPSCSYSRESMSEMASTGGSPRPGRRPTFGTAAYSRDGGSSNFLIKEHTNSVHGNINGNGSHAPHACAAAPPVQRYQPRGPAMPAPMPLPPAANTLQSVSPTFSRRSLTSTHNSSFAADEGSASLVPTSSSNDGSTVDMREVTRQLVETFNLPHEELNVLQHLSEMPMKYRVMSLTRWLRYVSTHTKLFPERSRISKLFALLLAQHVLEPAQLQTVLLEWLRFDVKNSEYDVCPRMFENIAHMVMDAYGEESATVEKIEDVRELLHGGLFNFMLHELTIDRGTDQMATLIKAVHPITSQVVQLLRDPVSELDALRTAVEHRFRLLPYLLSVSGVTESEMPGGPTPGSSTMASRLGTPLLRSSALGDSLTSTGHYDPLTQCLSFPKLASDVELSLYRRISADPATEKQPNAWVDEALRLMAAEGSSTKLAGAITLMKIVGAMLACSSVCVHKKHLLSAQDVDMALSRILAARPSPLLQSAAVMELVMHHTQALTECECGNGRMEKLREVFDRWTKAKLVEKTTVLNHLQRLNEATAYVTYHNFIAEVPWSKLLQGMLC